MSSTQKDCKSWDIIWDGVFMQRLEYCEDVSYEYACSDLVDNYNYHPNEQGLSILRVDDQIEFPFIYVISPKKYAFQLCHLSYQESHDLRVAGCEIMNGTEYAKRVDQDYDLTSEPYGIDQYRNNCCDDRGVWFPLGHDQDLVSFVIDFKL